MTILQKLRDHLLDEGSDKIYISAEDYDFLSTQRWSDEWVGETCNIIFYTDKSVWFVSDYDGSHQFHSTPRNPTDSTLPFSL